jgi:hypothetical protein
LFDDTFSATHHAAGAADGDPFTLNADNYTETTWKAASLTNNYLLTKLHHLPNGFLLSMNITYLPATYSMHIDT